MSLFHFFLNLAFSFIVYAVVNSQLTDINKELSVLKTQVSVLIQELKDKS